MVTNTHTHAHHMINHIHPYTNACACYLGTSIVVVAAAARILQMEGDAWRARECAESLAHAACGEGLVAPVQLGLRWRQVGRRGTERDREGGGGR